MWSNETWLLESQLSPVGIKVYVTCPIDEEFFRQRIPWAIVASIHGPSLGRDDDFYVSLNRWKNKKNEFLAYLEKIRRVAG